jgi:phosphate starvation-inducible membrane PsiE
VAGVLCALLPLLRLVWIEKQKCAGLVVVAASILVLAVVIVIASA